MAETDLSFWQRPLGARPDPYRRSFDTSEPIIRDIAGNEYVVTPQMVERPEGGYVRNALSRIYEMNLRDVPNALAGLARGVWETVEAPGNALRGEPVTYGDAMMTALDYGLLGAPMSAPAGALRANSFRAYHGSPHTFDRFSMDRIGTGEGAQAYGHGLYFAENEGVARAYRDALSRPYYQTADGRNIASAYGDDVAAAFDGVNGDPAELRDAIQRLETSVRRDLEDFGVPRVEDLPPPEWDGDFVSTVRRRAAAADGLRRLLASGDIRRVGEGSLYEVQINADPDTFLDWDAPIRTQHRLIQDAVAARGSQILPGRDTGEWHGDMAHRAFYPQTDMDGRDWLQNGPAADASRRLLDAGIPGIRYLDQGSRGAGTGTRNFVVFDDRLIDIVRRYGWGVPVAGGAVAVSQEEMDELRNYLEGA